MKPVDFERHDSGKRHMSDLQDRIEEFSRQVSDCPLIVGNLIADVSITSGTPEAVAHGLGRTPEGWIVVRRDADATVFESGDYDSKWLTLDAGANVTVSVWVY